MTSRSSGTVPDSSFLRLCLQFQRHRLWSFTPRARLSPAGMRSASSAQRPVPPLRSSSGVTETCSSLIGRGRETLGPLNTSGAVVFKSHCIPLELHAWSCFAPLRCFTSPDIESIFQNHKDFICPLKSHSQLKNVPHDTREVLRP